MELATTYPVQEARDVSHPTGTIVVPQQQANRRGQSARTIFGRLLASIVNGSEHPCWRSHDVFTQLALLPPHAAGRLLDSGRVTTKGER